MNDYIRTILSAVIFISIILSILPKENVGKHVNFTVGLITIAIILLPIFNISNNLDLSFSNIKMQALETKETDYLMDEFEKTLSLRVEEKLKNETGISFTVTIHGETDESGAITGVSHAEIMPYSEKYAKIVAEVLGVTVDKVVEK